jgi:hypothetical protein
MTFWLTAFGQTARAAEQAAAAQSVAPKTGEIPFTCCSLTTITKTIPRNKKTVLEALDEVGLPPSCNFVSAGAWSNVSAQSCPDCGTIAIGTWTTNPINYCTTHIYPFATVYYTWTGTNKLTTTFNATWKTPDGAYDWPFKFIVNVAPVISCASSSKVCPNLWWFGNDSSGKNIPQPENYSTVLEASPNGAKKYAWTITAGQSYAQFSNDKNTIDTTDNTVEVLPKSDPGPSGAPVVTITVSADGGPASAPFKLDVLKPHAIISVGKPVDVANGTGVFYQSTITYAIVDQLGEILPQPVPAREVFTKDEDFPVDDFPHDNWSPGVNGDKYSGQPSNPSALHDLITGPSIINTPDPKATVPCKPLLCKTKVIHWCGYVEVGSANAGEGVMVATLAWEKYTDHGRNCNLASPPASDNPGSKLPDCPKAGQMSCPP